MDMLPYICASVCERQLCTTGLRRGKTQACLSWPQHQRLGAQLQQERVLVSFLGAVLYR